MLHRTASSALTITRSQIRTAKYVREGIWARGDYGLYTMDDPRIFRPGLRRQYPYHKQLQWSKPYMCLRHGRAAPPGGAVHLAVVYRQFELAPAFYDFQRRLKCELPGAKVVAEAVDPNTNASTDSYFQIIRLNDGRTLWAASETEEVKNRLSELEAKRKEFQKAKEDQQHLKAQTADVVLDFRFQACPPKVDETAEWAMAIRHTVAAEAGLHKDQVQVTQSKEANQIIIATIPCADPGSAAVVAHGLLATDGACRLCLAVSEELAKTASGDAARELVERPELRVQVKMGGRGGEVQGRDVEQSEKRVALLPKKMTEEAQQSSVNLLEEVLLSELCQEVSSLLRQRLPQIVQAAQEHFHIRYEAAWPEPAEAAWPEL